MLIKRGMEEVRKRELPKKKKVKDARIVCFPSSPNTTKKALQKKDIVSG